MITLQIECDKTKMPNIEKKWIHKICNYILLDYKHSDAIITIIFSNDKQLQELKNKYFSQNVLTDTISFNLEEKGDPIDGEIYISLERVAENAKLYKQKFDKEIKRVIIHSILHLTGINDQTEDEKNRMTILENFYLSKNLNNTLA